MAREQTPFTAGERLPGTKYIVVKPLGPRANGALEVVGTSTADPAPRAAIKLLDPSIAAHPELRERFFQEARLIASLEHPNIVRITDVGELEDGTPYFATELLHGRTVRDILLDSKGIQPLLLHRIMIDVLDGLGYAHAHDPQILHRDLTCENLFIHTADGQDPCVKILDFGMVGGSCSVTDDVLFVGTRGYIAPEQLRGELLTPQSDLYSAALILYEGLAGRGPFDHMTFLSQDRGDRRKALTRAHLELPAPPVRRFVEWVPEMVDELLQSALAKEPAERPATAQDFASKLFMLQFVGDIEIPANRTVPLSDLGAISSYRAAEAAKPSVNDTVGDHAHGLKALAEPTQELHEAVTVERPVEEHALRSDEATRRLAIEEANPQAVIATVVLPASAVSEPVPQVLEEEELAPETDPFAGVEQVSPPTSEPPPPSLASEEASPQPAAASRDSFRGRFEREVDYLWHRLRALGERYPRLSALYARNADSRVARLVQSAAFAFASARSRLHDDGQALVRPLVAGAMPECLRPRPASTILQLTRSTNSAHGRYVGHAGGEEIVFRLAWPVSVTGIALSDVYVERVHADLQLLRMTISGRPGVVLGTVLPDSLRVFVRLDRPATALTLIHALRTSRNRIRVKERDVKGRSAPESKLPLGTLTWPRVDTDEPALSAAPTDRFLSSTLLRDLYAFPESFCFFDLKLGSLRNGTLAQLDLALPLSQIVEAAQSLNADNLLLSCGPATNEYTAPIERLQSMSGERQWSLAVAAHPRAEVLHIAGLRHGTPHNTKSQRDLLSWEAPSTPRAFEPDASYYLVEQDLGVGDGPTEVRVSLATAEGFDQPLPEGIVEGSVLASDGEIADSLGLGSIGRANGAANVTRVAPSRRAPLGHNHAWRMNAYARMPPTRFVTPSYLREFVALHDSSDARDENARICIPSFTRVTHSRVHRLVDGMLEWGDEFVVEMDAPQASPGEAWLLGELLSRAIAERNERLRYSTLTVTRGEARTGFAPRQGVRLPFPLG